VVSGNTTIASSINAPPIQPQTATGKKFIVSFYRWDIALSGTDMYIATYLTESYKIWQLTAEQSAATEVGQRQPHGQG
jgi:hypothetical protein